MYFISKRAPNSSKWCFFSLNLLNSQLLVVCRQISSFFYCFRDKFNQKGPTKTKFQNLNFLIFYPIIAIFAILFKKGVEKWHKFRNFAYLEAIDIEIVKQDIFPKYSWSSILLCPTHYWVQTFTVSSKILCPHLLSIYTCSTFLCQHAAFVSSFDLHRLYI